MKAKVLNLLCLLLFSSSSLAAALEMKFEERLLAAPFDSGTQQLVSGDGRVQAVLKDHRATVRGKFSGLSSPVRAARLFISPMVGVFPGMLLFSLSVSPDAEGKSGTFTGNFQLSVEQVAAMANQQFYVQLDTRDTTDGALVGWLMKAKPYAGEGVPEYGPGYRN